MGVINTPIGIFITSFLAFNSPYPLWQVVKTGTVERSVLDGIGHVDRSMDQFREEANMCRKLCIREGLTLPQVQDKYFSGSVK